VRAALSEVTQDLEELDQLIADVLTAARLDTEGLPPLRHEAVDVDALCARAAAKFRAAHPQHELRVNVNAADRHLSGDAILLRRMIENVLDNAGKYSDAGTAVELRVDDDERGLAFTVVDHGIGIDAADLPLLTTPFFRADRSRARTTGGVGLGLALARRIAEAHGGTIAIHSVVAEGTRARICVAR
jgi:signal transduction histidine kinase